MMDDLEMVAFELERHWQLTQEKLQRNVVQVEELNKIVGSSNVEISSLKGQLMKAQADNQGLKAQLHVRSVATQRLELENSSMRDILAKLQVQIDSSVAERQKFLQRCQLLESERLEWKHKCDELQKSSSEHVSYKVQCHVLQTQLRATVGQITRQQELLSKDYVKVERTVQEAISFAKSVAAHSAQQASFAKQANQIKRELENKIMQLSGKLIDVRKERDRLLEERNDGEIGGDKYLSDWQHYQAEMKKRLEGYMEENMKLVEELNLAGQSKETFCNNKKEDSHHDKLVEEGTNLLEQSGVA